jgi:O-antigen/teichoic acid export membrane protein
MSIGVRLHLSSISAFLNLRIDLLLVGALIAEREAGLYSLSVSLAEIVFALTYSLTIGMLHRQTEATESVAVEYTLDFTRQNFALSIALAGIAAAVSYPAIVLVYGADWQGSVLPFAILALAVTALAIEGPMRDLLVRIGNPWLVSAASTVALVANVALNLVLIPQIGIAGAAVASLASYWLAAILMMLLVSRTAHVRATSVLDRPREGDIVRTLPALVVAAVARRSPRDAHA